MKDDAEKERLLESSAPPADPLSTIAFPRCCWLTLCASLCVVSMVACSLIGFAIPHSRTPSLDLSTIAPESPSTSDDSTGHWVATWTAAPQACPVAASMPPKFYQNNVTLSNNTILQDPRNPFNTSVSLVFEDTTVRQTHRTSIGADKIRIRFSNAFASSKLPIEKVTIAIPEPERTLRGVMTSGSSKIRGPTLQTLTFAGRTGITIPPRGLAVSDPLQFPIQPAQVISLSLYFKYGQVTEAITGHVVSITTTWLQRGDHTANTDLRSSGAGRTPHWFVTSAVEAWKSPEYGALVVVGDSLTDRGSAKSNTDERWPNFLSTRMHDSSDAAIRSISIVSQALGGNRLMFDGKGPNLISRLDRDVLAVSGVRYVMMFEGVLDINHGADEEDDQRASGELLKMQYRQVVTRLHNAGLPVFGSTLAPFSCVDYPDAGNNANRPQKEAERLRINSWIRNERPFDAVIDFDRVLRNPRNHTELLPAYNSGDCIHPNSEGVRALADAFPLDLFEKFKDGFHGYV